MARAVVATIRPARADDAEFISRTILLAQRGPYPRGWFDIMLDRPEAEVLAFVSKLAIARAVSWYHASQFLIAELQGAPAAALCAMPAGGTRASARAAITEVAAAVGIDAAGQSAMFDRGAYARSCWIQGGEDDWLIEHVAVQPAFRGRGLMQALLARALEAGKAAGYARASITFVIGNDAAERCYAKAGFSFAEEKRDAGFEAITGSPGFRRFERVS
jgi:GNAT superfamily N-acetyltransferase